MTAKRTDVVVIGAGPYGLSLASHLDAAGVRFRQFGLPMHFWTSAMPAGMFLKSQGFASNLSDPAGNHTLEAFCAQTGRAYAPYGLPVPIDTFVAYGRWFQQRLAPAVEHIMVEQVDRVDGHFQVLLQGGQVVDTRAVVVATGIEHYAHLPTSLGQLPADRCSHTSEHSDLKEFAGRDVTVIGGGQSALESAALLHEFGATVRVVIRRPEVVWNGPLLPTSRPLRQRLREPVAGLGSGWTTWFYSSAPRAFTYLPPGKRAEIARTALGPAGAEWLRPRVEGRFPILPGYSVAGAEPGEDGVTLRLRAPDGIHIDLVTDHVLAATGYRTDVDRLSFLSPALRSSTDRLGRTPRLARDFQSSVPGLYFIGVSAATTFGPVMRFVYGTDFASRTVTSRLATGSATPLQERAVA